MFEFYFFITAVEKGEEKGLRNLDTIQACYFMKILIFIVLTHSIVINCFSFSFHVLNFLLSLLYFSHCSIVLIFFISTELESGLRKKEKKRKRAELKMDFSQGTSVVQLLSGNILDDLAAAYGLAVENFEKAARIVFRDLGARGVPLDTSSVADASLPAAAGFLSVCLLFF